MRKNRQPLVPPPQDESTALLTLQVRSPFLDFLNRLRTFYGGARPEHIVENLVRYAAEKREHFVPANYEPYASDEAAEGPVKRRRNRKPRNDEPESDDRQ
jgi:hypothetical protein